MPDVRDVFPSKYLTADDLKGQSRTVAIHSISPEVLGQGPQSTTKLVLTVRTLDGRPLAKQLVLNKTNSMNLAAVFGWDYDNWLGKSITLRSESVLFQGRPQPAIRCYAADPAKAAAKEPAAPAQPPAAPSGPFADMSDDVPW